MGRPKGSRNKNKSTESISWSFPAHIEEGKIFKKDYKKVNIDQFINSPTSIFRPTKGLEIVKAKKSKGVKKKWYKEQKNRSLVLEFVNWLITETYYQKDNGLWYKKKVRYRVELTISKTLEELFDIYMNTL